MRFTTPTAWPAGQNDPAAGSVVHLKGFGLRVQVSDEDNRRSHAECLQFLLKRRASTIVWDGDNFSPESFTRLLVDLFDAMQQQSDADEAGAQPIKFAAFLREEDRDRFRKVG